MRSLLFAFSLLIACARPSPTTVPPAEPHGSEVAEAGRQAPVEGHGPQPESPRGSVAPPEPGVATRPSTPHAAEPTAGEPASDAYDRAAWPHWIDADGDCQDTRTEVLVAESIVAVTYTDARACEVATGKWRCPYTDRTFTDPRQLDVDHFVPLAEAHRSGGDRWSKTERTAYANDLRDPEHLVAVYKGANRSKGAKNITAWLPEEPGSRCTYVATWLHIKEHWHLRVDDDERAAANDYLAVCAAKGVPELAAKSKPARAPVHDASGTTRACCRTCKSGKPCGDACIAADKTCHKPAGCACAAQ